MMKEVGVKSLDDLVDRTVPHSIRLDKVRESHASRASSSRSCSAFGFFWHLPCVRVRMLENDTGCTPSTHVVAIDQMKNRGPEGLSFIVGVFLVIMLILASI